MTPEMDEAFRDQHRKFVAQHGREPGPDDRIFFDMPHSEQIEHQLVEAMKRAGINPALIHAFEQTGRIVTEENQHLLSKADLDEWQAAIEEYEIEHRPPSEYPIGTVAQYGPDDRRMTKIAACVIVKPDAEPIVERWVATDVMTNPKVQEEIKEFFGRHGVKSVIGSGGNIGCAHEEGEDFPEGEDCPFCPFWQGKQGSRMF